MNPELLENVLSCPSLPSLPAVATQVIELTNDENVHLDDLAEVIKADQGLASKVLRTVNSSFYGLRQPCATIEKALVMLGLGPVKSLALGFSLVSAVDYANAEQFDFRSYWKRGIDTAVAARNIARAAKLDCADEAFLAGLLHDIGMVAMFRALDTEYTEIIDQVGVDHEQLCQAELKVFELQHPEIGAMLAQRWKLPPELVIPIRYHARPTASPLEHAQIARVVAAGNTAHEVLSGEHAAEHLDTFYTRCRDWFDLDQDAADDILRGITDDTAELARLFSLDTGSNADPNDIIAEARQRLASLTRDEPRESYGVGRFEGIIESPRNDPLTGAVNRTGFNEVINAAYNAATRRGDLVSLAALAVDGIPETARLQGPEAADDVVIGVVSLLNAHFEPLGGSICRIGTATFAVIIPGTELDQAARAADECRRDIEQSASGWLNGRKGPAVTAAIGIAAADAATAPAYGSSAKFVAAATNALQAARAEGGNTVRTFQPRAAA